MPSMKGQHHIDDAKKVAEEVVELLKPYCGKIAIAGSVRRGKTVVGDIDIIVADTKDNFVERLEELGCTDTETKIVEFQMMCKGISVDITIVNGDMWGAALMHATGSVQENIRLRVKAKKMGYKLNEYGLWDSNGNIVAGRTEKEVYQALGEDFIESMDR